MLKKYAANFDLKYGSFLFFQKPKKNVNMILSELPHISIGRNYYDSTRMFKKREIMAF